MVMGRERNVNGTFLRSACRLRHDDDLGEGTDEGGLTGMSLVPRGAEVRLGI